MNTIFERKIDWEYFLIHQFKQFALGAQKISLDEMYVLVDKYDYALLSRITPPSLFTESLA